MDLKLLREATRPEHEATESAVPLGRPGLTRADYVKLLQRFHSVVCAWDSVAAEESPAALADMLRERRRCSSLEADLRVFGTKADQEPPATLRDEIRDLIRNPAENDAENHEFRFLGAMYVLEGSTLGGQYIAQQVQDELQLTAGEGNQFFRGYGKQTIPKWREFQQVLAAVPENRSDIVIGAAKGMFGIFQRWMTMHQAAQDERMVSPDENPATFRDQSTS